MFDASAATARLQRLWALTAHFGVERGMYRVLLDEIVSDRMQFVSGLQVLRDELQLARNSGKGDRGACEADLSVPSVATTLAFTNCGDRIHQGEIDVYKDVVASRFAALSEIGTLKPESFSPTGGGTDDGATLAHVTWAHLLDEPLRRRIYEGNAQSFTLSAFDLKAHVGRLDTEAGVTYGTSQESPWREPRAACGAIAATLAHFNAGNPVHRRIRDNLGEENFALLSGPGVRTKEGVDITSVVAAAIVAVRGLLDTTIATEHEMDERGVAHLTACITVNRHSMPDTMLYLARATVFGGERRVHGFGTDATKYAGVMGERRGDKRLVLTYDGMDGWALPVSTDTYVPRASVPSDPFA